MKAKTNAPQVAVKKPNRRPITMKMRLKEIVTANKSTAVRMNKLLGFESQSIRETILFQGFTQLKTLGFHLHDPANFKPKHIIALDKFWEGQGLESSTLQNRISTFRTFCGWIGKPNMIGDSADYVDDKECVKRTYAAEPQPQPQRGQDPYRGCHPSKLQLLFR